MSTASINGSGATTAEHLPDRTTSGGSRGVRALVKTLDELIGAHPATLRELFGDARATKPSELGHATRGRFLAFEPAHDVHFLMRPVLHALTGGAMPWKGKVFDEGGTGANLMLGRTMMP